MIGHNGIERGLRLPGLELLLELFAYPVYFLFEHAGWCCYTNVCKIATGRSTEQFADHSGEPVGATQYARGNTFVGGSIDAIQTQSTGL